jgi:hypothetical protein
MKPQQKDLFTKRFRNVPELEPTELQIQIALIERLGWMALENVVYFHVPNGELRDKRAAAKLKAAGVLPGVSDLIFLYYRFDDSSKRLRVLCLELKAPGRRPSDEQRYFGSRVKRLGVAFEVADSIDQAVELLESYGVLPCRKRQGQP